VVNILLRELNIKGLHKKAIFTFKMEEYKQSFKTEVEVSECAFKN
jgi:hypothetical protein